MAGKIKIAVMMGGNSPEYEISLMSGREVAKNLNPRKYQVLPIIISRDGKNWQVEKSKNLEYTFRLETRPKRAIENLKLDVAFIAMHGPYGEDGTIQGFLELLGIPYTGSGVLASALGMDKIYSRKLFTHAGLLTPRFTAIKKRQKTPDIFKKFKLPVFVKPNNQGSSIGASKVSKKKNLKKALQYAHKFNDLALVEEFLNGIEVTGSIIGNDKPKALPFVEIVPKKEFFDYEAKYNERLCDEIVPARISKTLTQKAQEAALVAYKTLGCRGFGRVDMIIKGNNVYVLELNTIPGLTSVSLLPKAAKAAGITYPQLLDKIIDLATP